MDYELVSLAAAAGATLPWLKRRLELSRAKHPSLAGHARLAKRLARWMPGYAYDETRFFSCDGAPQDMAQLRRAGFMALAARLAAKAPRTLALTQQMREGIADLRFTGAYRVPYQFSPYVRQHLKVGAFVERAEGVSVTDLDGNRYLDLAGSYGVNVLGVDFYKQTIAAGSALVQELGPVLGAYHPCVADNVRRLQAISGLDDVSFHMSGTEAVMQAVRLARYHTGRRYLVRFTGAYHGWWEDVQPGPGNPLPPRETYTLRDLHPASLQVLRTRRDIACVLVNPLQALHPNRNAPGDSTLIDSSRSAGYDRAAYTRWLQQLREVCSERGIVLIFDEVFLGFRLAPGGAQEYFGVRADLVTYGKTLGGGLPVGVVCGRRELMQRYREDRPADICFARGTFNAHPYVMGAMNAFLHQLDTPEVRARYQDLDAIWDARRERFNQRLAAEGLPVRAANMGTVWTLTYTQPSRYNWMLQFYLRDHGLALSWVGTGRLIFNLAWNDGDFDDMLERFVQAARQMQRAAKR
ncbi:MAG: aminotransferase class III-fold pyridoxal phosphate-dependent enzyme, partial [Hylemonella sp.]